MLEKMADLAGLTKYVIKKYNQKKIRNDFPKRLHDSLMPLLEYIKINEGYGIKILFVVLVRFAKVKNY
jgi:hypothetical protein